MKFGLADTICLIAWIALPSAFAVWWIRMRLGIDKRWFVMPSAPLISRNFYFALPAFTLGFMIFVVGMVLFYLDPKNDTSIKYFYLTIGFWALAYVLAYFQPDWLSPTWYRWLKEKHGNILPLLAQEAQRLGREEWLKRVETQEDLEQWVADFRANLGQVGRK